MLAATFRLLLLLLMSSTSAHAMWFEASGQAVIHDGQKQAARHLATQEAIKQALLFAGASVNSVQKMANGLLEDDRFEISASGEVSNIELIDEIYHKDYVTVSIRADIFPQEAMCAASHYKKNITTTWYDLQNRQQAAAGNLYDFGKTLATKLQQASQIIGRYSVIEQIEPYYLKPTNKEQRAIAYNLARKTNNQFVLFGEIAEFSVEKVAQSEWGFWQENKVARNLTLVLKMYDGYSGEMVYQKNQTISASWDFDLHKSINSNSDKLWRSSFGLATTQMLQNNIQEIDESLSCLPSYGRVIKAGNENLVINIGKQNGVKEGDTLTLFKVNQFYTPQGQQHRQFHLHPTRVNVTQVFAETASVKSLDGSPLVNIQPNDFVARR